MAAPLGQCTRNGNAPRLAAYRLARHGVDLVSETDLGGQLVGKLARIVTSHIRSHPSVDASPSSERTWSGAFPIDDMERHDDRLMPRGWLPLPTIDRVHD